MEKDLKLYNRYSTIFMILSICILVLAIYAGFLFVFEGSQLSHVTAFICTIMLACFCFFAGQMFDKLSEGKQTSSYLEQERRKAIRAAVYGMITSFVGGICIYVAYLLS